MCPCTAVRCAAAQPRHARPSEWGVGRQLGRCLRSRCHRGMQHRHTGRIGRAQGCTKHHSHQSRPPQGLGSQAQVLLQRPAMLLATNCYRWNDARHGQHTHVGMSPAIRNLLKGSPTLGQCARRQPQRIGEPAPLAPECGFARALLGRERDLYEMSTATVAVPYPPYILLRLRSFDSICDKARGRLRASLVPLCKHNPPLPWG